MAELIAAAGILKYTVGGLMASGVGVGLFAMARFRSVPATKFMAKTGLFIKGVHVSRKTFQLPFQQIKVISLSPTNYHFLGSNMSKELVPFKLPLTFTVSPRHPEKDMDGFVRYASRLGDMNNEEVQHIIGGIVNGETRAFVATMTIPEIFSDRDAFRKHVIYRVQEDLDQFGLEIQNANIEEMHDTEGNSYFANLKKKALEGANTSSRVDVAEARKHGDIGEKTREVDTRKEKSVLEADAKQTETQQNQKMSDYSRELGITTTTNKQKEDIAKIEAHQLTESKKIQVEADLNKQKQSQELERLRSEQLIKATAEAEAIIKKAEADATTTKIKAEADATATKIKAEAQFYSKSKEADAVKLLLDAQSEGLRGIYDVSKTNPEMASFYLALDKGVFNRDGLFSVLAEKQAEAIRGLNPKINIWNTGAQGTGNNYTDVISNLGKTVPPILDALQQQTGLRLPSFLMDSVKETAIAKISEANK